MSTVRHRVTLTSLGCECDNRAGIPISVILSWSAESPHEILLIFPAPPDGYVVWCMALDLLIDGLLYGPAGLGDISIFPCLDDPWRVELILDSPSHPHAVGFTVPRRPLWEFVAAVQTANNVTTGKGA